jgi:hypothetical protein
LNERFLFIFSLLFSNPILKSFNMTSEANTTFPHDVLTPLANKRPSVAALHKLNQEITANALSVHSLGGNGLLGYYALVVDQATYLTAYGNIPFDIPVHPGVLPTHAAGTTNVMMTNVDRQYAADIAAFTTYRNTEASLKRQIIQAVPGTYTN